MSTPWTNRERRRLATARTDRYSVLSERLELRGGLFLHAWYYVAVEVERGPDVGVTAATAGFTRRPE